MFTKNGASRPLKNYESIIFVLIGLALNGIGNGIAVTTGMGSAAWTAASANLQVITLIPKGYFLFLFGFLSALSVIILTKKFDLKHFIGNMLFVLFFSYLVNFASQFFIIFSDFPLVIRIIIDALSVVVVGTGISITMRVSLITHPLDDLVIYTRFRYFKGNPLISQVVNFSFPMVISLLIWITTGKITSINIGTLFSFFGIGAVIGWADDHVMPSLVYRRSL
ncbi:MAG: hypothetical protein LBT37_02385 [Lactobacillaceae bacterium]|jgi:uncharacterized membrane protein YczE|nr:hypothetical protein [Lactobacillaceae bacterium]